MHHRQFIVVSISSVYWDKDFFPIYPNWNHPLLRPGQPILVQAPICPWLHLQRLQSPFGTNQFPCLYILPSLSMQPGCLLSQSMHAVLEWLFPGCQFQQSSLGLPFLQMRSLQSPLGMKRSPSFTALPSPSSQVYSEQSRKPSFPSPSVQYFRSLSGYEQTHLLQRSILNQSPVATLLPFQSTQPPSHDKLLTIPPSDARPST